MSIPDSEKNSKSKIILYNFLAWILYLLVNNFLFFLNDGALITSIRTILTYPLVAVVFYINAHLILDKLYNRSKILIFLYTILLIMAYCLARYSLYKYILSPLSFQIPYEKLNFSHSKIHIDSIGIIIQFLLMSYGYWFALHQIRLIKEKQELNVNLARLVQEKAESELAFFRAQINPHFLYNTFNFLFSEAIMVSSKLADAIMSLSNIMRTITELGKDKFIPLSKEIDHIKSYLKLQQYRFGETLNIDFRIDGNEYLPHTFVPPLVFISFVENIFKHGELGPKTPCIIYFEVDEKSLIFGTSNQKKIGIKEKSSGIGIDNIINQLKLIYKDDFSIKKTETEDEFSLEITILDTSITQYITET